MTLACRDGIMATAGRNERASLAVRQGEAASAIVGLSARKRLLRCLLQPGKQFRISQIANKDRSSGIILAMIATRIKISRRGDGGRNFFRFSSGHY